MSSAKSVKFAITSNRETKMLIEEKISLISQKPLPKHVAVIMDGNGRWAKSRGLDRSMGHIEGVAAVRRITEIASDLGIGYLTLYTFSTENWNRPKEEVDALMHLIAVAIERETPDLIKNNVKLKLIGNLSTIPAYALDRLHNCEKATAHCTGMQMILAISYSSRWEITEAIRAIANHVKEGKLKPEDINEQTVIESLSTADIPDPDLLIRTGGNSRISNYLLWQIAYAELIFVDTYWPDYTKEDFCDAIITYQGSERRFGKTSEQVNQNE